MTEEKRLRWRDTGAVKTFFIEMGNEPYSGVSSIGSRVTVIPLAWISSMVKVTSPNALVYMENVIRDIATTSKRTRDIFKTTSELQHRGF
jgi:hypothetical protein